MAAERLSRHGMTGELQATLEDQEKARIAAANYCVRKGLGADELQGILEHLGLIPSGEVLSKPKYYGSGDRTKGEPAPAKSLNQITGRSSKYIPVSELTPEQHEKRKAVSRAKKERARLRHQEQHEDSSKGAAG